MDNIVKNQNLQWLYNIVDKETLKDNFTYIAIFIALYESMADFVVDNVKELLSIQSIEDGKLVEKITDSYKIKVKNKIVDDKGNKDITKASFLFLIDHNIISEEDYQGFLKMKEIRNKYSHEMLSVITQSIPENEYSLLFDMMTLFNKISKNWFLEVEASIQGIEISEEMDAEHITSVQSGIYTIIFDVLYNNKSEELRRIIDNAKKEQS